MKNKKEKRRILKVRPFNMANFSGGSGYLVFSLIYQAMAILPAMIIIWATSLISLKKNKKKKILIQKGSKKVLRNRYSCLCGSCHCRSCLRVLLS